MLIDDKIVPIKNMEALEAEFQKLCERIPVVVRKVQEGRAFFFAPRRIRESIGQLADFFEKIELAKIDGHTKDAYRARLNQLVKLLQKEVGLK
jgi:hypothetical protein